MSFIPLVRSAASPPHRRFAYRGCGPRCACLPHPNHRRLMRHGRLVGLGLATRARFLPQSENGMRALPPCVYAVFTLSVDMWLSKVLRLLKGTTQSQPAPSRVTLRRTAIIILFGIMGSRKHACELPFVLLVLYGASRRALYPVVPCLVSWLFDVDPSPHTLPCSTQLTSAGGAARAAFGRPEDTGWRTHAPPDGRRRRIFTL